MGKKKDAMNVTDSAKQGSNGDLNILWFFAGAALLSAMFFSISLWLRTPKEKIVHCRSHLCPKAAPIPKAARQVNGYKVAY
jgi:hypothetical protein